MRIHAHAITTNPTTQPKDSIAAFLHMGISGRAYEEMHFLFNANVRGLHGLAVAAMWVPWVTRGLSVTHTHIHTYVLTLPLPPPKHKHSPRTALLRSSAWASRGALTRRCTSCSTPTCTACTGSRSPPCGCRGSPVVSSWARGESFSAHRYGRKREHFGCIRKMTIA